MSDMFEKATRVRLRFSTTRGLLSVEDLWDIPLVSINNGFSLDDIAKDLNKKVKASGEESFVVKKSKVDAILALKFDIVKHVIEVQLTEAGEHAKEKLSYTRRKQLLNLIADKKEEGLKSKSLDDLEKMLAETVIV